MVFYVCEVFLLSIRILSVTAGSPADQAGIISGEQIVSINQEQVMDEIDYQALSTASRLSIVLSSGAQTRLVSIRKNEWEPLGLCLDETEAMKPRHCANRCMFCFVDQLPAGMRETLYVKDDDWRLSLMMGNYVTLTNVSDSEFSRILARKASPLFISVHATDPSVRCEMLRNPNAGKLMDRLRTLRDNHLEFHCQIVLCPGINDGVVLQNTVEDLASLFPASRSLAIVPVGLTKHRKELKKLNLFNAESAGALLDLVERYQARFLKELGTRFVFPSDEFYCLSGRSIPPDCEYEDYPQIENGVGMLRLLEQECAETHDDLLCSGTIPRPSGRLLIPTGVSAAPFIRKLADRYAPAGTDVRVIPVINRFFGESITVTGLIVGRDLIDAVSGIQCDRILICDTMLRDRTDCFLDDMTLAEVQKAVKKPVRVVRNSGESLIRALWGLEENNG